MPLIPDEVFDDYGDLIFPLVLLAAYVRHNVIRLDLHLYEYVLLRPLIRRLRRVIVIRVFLAPLPEGLQLLGIQVTFHDLLDVLAPQEDDLPVLGQETLGEVVVEQLEVPVEEASQGALCLLLEFYYQDIAEEKLGGRDVRVLNDALHF